MLSNLFWNFSVPEQRRVWIIGSFYDVLIKLLSLAINKEMFYAEDRADNEKRVEGNSPFIPEPRGGLFEECPKYRYRMTAFHSVVGVFYCGSLTFQHLVQCPTLHTNPPPGAFRVEPVRIPAIKLTIPWVKWNSQKEGNYFNINASRELFGALLNTNG